MRALGMVLLTGAAAVIVWKIFAALFIGFLGLALKVALVVVVVYFLMQIFKGKKEKEAAEG
jgi:predicted membrane protein